MSSSSNSNPYLIPLRSSSINNNNNGAQSISSNNDNNNKPKRAQATVLMSTGSSSSSSSAAHAFFGSGSNGGSRSDDWLYSGRTSGTSHQIPQKPKVASTSSLSRRASIERKNNNITESSTASSSVHPPPPPPIVVKFKNGGGNTNSNNNENEVLHHHHKSSNDDYYYSPQPVRVSTTLNRQHQHNLHHHQNDDDSINRFIYDDNDKTNVSMNHHHVIALNSDGSPIRSLNDVKGDNIDILPPASDDAAKDLARMIQEQGKALLEIRERENQMLIKQQKEQEEANNSSSPSSSYSPSAAAQRVLQSNNFEKRYDDTGRLPSKFAPLPAVGISNVKPPPRWRVPPTLPPRRRLLAEGAEGQPRLDLLDMLDKLDEEDEGKKGTNKSSSSASSYHHQTINNTGSRITSELWVYIFEYLDPRSLCLCSEVSKRWLIISRSEFLWQPILENNFQHLIQQEDQERQFQERTGVISAAPPRPLGTATDLANICPSLARISTFVSDHRGRIQQELTAMETRIQQTEDRMTLQGQRTNNTNNNNGVENNNNQQPISGLEREITNERSVLLRQLQDLEPKVRQLFDRLRDSEATQVTQSRSLNEAIISSKRSGLQLQAIHRRSQVADRRHKEKLALEDLERRLCLIVLNGAGNLLPVALRKSIRHFSQLELLLMSCANQESLSNLPKRWEKVKENVSLDILDELRKKVAESEDTEGVLGKLLARSEIETGVVMSSMTRSNNKESSSISTSTSMKAAPAAVAASSSSVGDSNRIRFADSLLNRRKQQQHNSSSSDNNNNNNKSNQHHHQTQSQQRTFSEDHELVKKKLVAEMALRMTDDESLERFLFP